MNRGLTQNNSVILQPKRRYLATSMLAALLGSHAAVAGDSEFYFGFGFGSSILDPSVDEDGIEVGSGTFAAWKTFVGYDLTNNLSAEAFFADLGHVDVDTSNATSTDTNEDETGLEAASSSDFVECDILGQCDDATSSANSGQIDYKVFGAGLLYHWPNNLPGFYGFGKLGVAQLKTSSNGVNWEKDDSTNVYAGLGAEYQLTNGFSIRGEYEFYDPEAQFISLNVLKRFGRPSALPQAPKIFDTDEDGIRDGLDQCPGTPAGTQVNAAGCEIKVMNKPAPKAPDPQLFDTDRDGVPDVKDLCLDTMPGVKVDARGCDQISTVAPPPAPVVMAPPPVVYSEPVIVAEPVIDTMAIERFTRVLEGVNFLVGSAQLTGEAKSILNGVADELMAYPSIRVTVVGHTDNTGGTAANKTLSEARALSVAEYLVNRGVLPEQMQYAGRGEEEPVASNATEMGRSQNRRVELIAEQL